MTSDIPSRTTLRNIGVMMFSVADQDEAIAFYVGTLGFELRGDTTFGEDGDHRWVEVAPPGSTARLALNPPMPDGRVGGSGIGVETPDVLAEHARLSAVDGVDAGPTPQQVPGAPLLFMVHDPWGNHIAIVEAPPGG